MGIFPYFPSFSEIQTVVRFLSFSGSFSSCESAEFDIRQSYFLDTNSVFPNIFVQSSDGCLLIGRLQRQV